MLQIIVSTFLYSKKIANSIILNQNIRIIVSFYQHPLCFKGRIFGDSSDRIRKKPRLYIFESKTLNVCLMISFLFFFELHDAEKILIYYSSVLFRTRFSNFHLAFFSLNIHRSRNISITWKPYQKASCFNWMTSFWSSYRYKWMF